jgi:Spy/CpxP family protein refolding chaperone
VNSWKVILATLIIYGAGVVTGGLLVSHAVRVKAHANTPKPPAVQAITPWQMRSKELLHRMERELNLDPQQREHVEKIILDSQERTKGLWKPIVPQMNREMQTVREQIRGELTPDQQRKFDELLKPHGGKKLDDSPMQERRHRSSANPVPAMTPATNSASPTP